MFKIFKQLFNRGRKHKHYKRGRRCTQWGSTHVITYASEPALCPYHVYNFPDGSIGVWYAMG